MTEILTLIDWASLSPEIRETIRTIGSRLAEGCSRSQIAKEFGLTEERVALRIDMMRKALLEQALARSDELSEQLRARIEELSGRPSSTA